MIDFTKETPVGVEAVATLFGVTRRTVENWFDYGLERRKVGGKVYTSREALQRFSESTEPRSVATIDEREQREALERSEQADREMKERWGI